MTELSESADTPFSCIVNYKLINSYLGQLEFVLWKEGSVSWEKVVGEKIRNFITQHNSN